MAETKPNHAGGFAGEQAGGGQRIAGDTWWVLQTGGLVYARIGEGAGAEILRASLIDIRQGAEPASDLGVRLEFESYSGRHQRAAAAGAKITVYILIKGVLYALPAHIVRSQADTTLRLAATVAGTCVGLSLRKSSRFSVLGTVRIYHSSIAEGYCQLFPIPLNISLGGFGLEAPGLDLTAGETARFVLKIFVEKNGEADRETPGLELAGLARACSRSELEPGSNYYGFRFTQIAADELAALAGWIEEHEAGLKQT